MNSIHEVKANLRRGGDGWSVTRIKQSLHFQCPVQLFWHSDTEYLRKLQTQSTQQEPDFVMGKSQELEDKLQEAIKIRKKEKKGGDLA